MIFLNMFYITENRDVYVILDYALYMLDFFNKEFLNGVFTNKWLYNQENLIEKLMMMLHL